MFCGSIYHAILVIDSVQVASAEARKASQSNACDSSAHWAPERQLSASIVVALKASDFTLRKASARDQVLLATNGNHQ